MLRLKYNSDSKLVQTDIITDSNDTYLPFEKFKYDNTGRKTEDAKFSGGKLVSKEAITYDSLGTLLSDACFGPDDKPIEKRTYTFDSKHNKTEDATFKADTLLKSIFINLMTRRIKSKLIHLRQGRLQEYYLNMIGLETPLKKLYIAATSLLQLQNAK